MSREIRENIPGIGNVVEWVAEADIQREGWEETVDIIVQPDCESLCITINASGTHGYLNGARGAEYRLTSPDNERTEIYMRAENGQLLYFISQPKHGKWKMQIRGNVESDVELNATALKRGWWKRLTQNRISCRICKYILKALIITLMIHLAPYLIGLKGMALFKAIPFQLQQLLEWIKNTLGLAQKIFEGLIDLISESLNDKIDEVMRKVCVFLRFCPIAEH